MTDSTVPKNFGRSIKLYSQILLGLMVVLTFNNCFGAFELKKDFGQASLGSTSASESSGAPGVPFTPPPNATPNQSLSGQALYNKYCLSCHQNVNGAPSKRGATYQSITTAIMQNETMRDTPALSTLKTSEISLISDYLSETITCRSDFAPQRIPLRVLTSREYDNIISDAFATSIRPSVLARFDLQGSGDSGFLNDSSRIPITALMVDKYHQAARLIADEAIRTAASPGSVIAQGASCLVSNSSPSDTCLNNSIRSLGLRLWRRPVYESGNTSELTRLRRVVLDSAKAGSNAGLKNLLTALLISPNFLTVSYHPDTPGIAGQVFTLNGYQRAMKLSFYLWQSGPDSLLLQAAQSGTLNSDAGMAAQVDRMLKDPKALRMSEVIASEMFGINKLTDISLTSINPDLLNSFKRETVQLIQDIIAQNHSVLKIVSADYSFLNKSLADYYGVVFTGPSANSFSRHDMKPTGRIGILNHAAFLVASAGATSETHPVVRGKILANRLACASIAPPPPNVVTANPGSLPPDATPKEILAVHTQNTSCFSCHKHLDPYGLALEVYDSFGKKRTNYAALGGRIIDQTGTLPTGENFSTTHQFMQILRGSPTVKNCISQNLLALGLTRSAASSDDVCTSRSIASTEVQETSTFSSLIKKITQTRQFLFQAVEGQ